MSTVNAVSYQITVLDNFIPKRVKLKSASQDIQQTNNFKDQIKP